MMSRRKQSHPKSVKRDDLPGGMTSMEEESSLATTTNSLNGDDGAVKSPGSTASEDEEPIEEDGVSLTSSSAGAVSPPRASPLPPAAGVKQELPEEPAPVATSGARPLPPPPLPVMEVTSLKRRRDEASPPPPSMPPLHHHGLPFSADLLQSLQYFALLRQSLPNGSLMNLPGVPPPPAPRQVSPPPPPIKQTSGLNHACPSCGICFSSASTLAAHVTYYCSKRPQPPGAAPPSAANAEPLPAHPETVGTPLSNGNRSLTPDQQAPDDMDRPSAPKIRRSGRYYACPYCSFSADKRVSLNRHMRVHVGLPLLATHPVSPPPPPPTQLSIGGSNLPDTPHRSLSDPMLAGSSPEFRISKMPTEEHHPQHLKPSGADASGGAPDRYCTDCKIQFSSLKTFQVHKQHYCQSRKPPQGIPSVGIPEELEKVNQQMAEGSTGPMTILVLPTHPPIVVPLCILQSARLLTAEQPMPSRSIIVSPHGDIQFRTDSPEQRPTGSTRPVTPPPAPAPLEAPAPTAAPATTPARDDQALDLSSKTSEMEEDSTPPASVEPVPSASVTGTIRIREELAHVNNQSPVVASGPTAASGTANPALPFLPPKVFAELEALGMCLGVPSGHDMSGNPAQWLAMLENAVLQASSLAPGAPGSSAAVKPGSNLVKARQAQRPSSTIPCEECNISFRRMESYLVHKQYYCAARHQQQPAGKEIPPPPPETNGNANQPEDTGPPSSAGQREPVIQRTSTGKIACPACGIEFESAITLQAHRSFYCSKREASDPAVQLVKNLIAEGRKSIPEIASALPSTASLAGPASTNNNGGVVSPAAGGSGAVPQQQPQQVMQQQQTQQGWKCPCCDTVSPTAASAQKHVETHSNVRAFRCSVCGYRGNTLRGMRTHVRIHFDRRTSPVELCEDNYISCIMGGNGVGAGGPETEAFNTPASVGVPSGSPPDVDQICKSLGIPPEVCAKVLSTSPESSALGGVRPGRELGGSSLAGLQFLQLAQRIANHSPGPTTGAGCRSDKLFLCDLCCYSSSYRGNVIRHSKLVHGREISDVAVVSSNFLQQAVTSKTPSGNSMPFDGSRMVTSKLTENSPPPGGLAGTPVLSASPDETVQVKIDPEDLLLMHQQSMTGGSNNSSHSGHSPLAEYNPQPTAAATPTSTGSDQFRKHCKSCNITFTYMNTFLAHKKYYCSSHAPLDQHDLMQPDDELDEEVSSVGGIQRPASASPPPKSEAQHSAEPTHT